MVVSQRIGRFSPTPHCIGFHKLKGKYSTPEGGSGMQAGTGTERQTDVPTVMERCDSKRLTVKESEGHLLREPASGYCDTVGLVWNRNSTGPTMHDGHGGDIAGEFRLSPQPKRRGLSQRKPELLTAY